TVTASAPAYAPSTATVTITAGGTTTQNFALNGAGPTLVYQSSAVDDSTTGNNNGHIDQNECVNLNVTLRNNGGTTATGISATLSTTTTGVTVSTATSTYPNIAPAATGTNTTPFQISTSASF